MNQIEKVYKGLAYHESCLIMFSQCWQYCNYNVATTVHAIWFYGQNSLTQSSVTQRRGMDIYFYVTFWIFNFKFSQSTKYLCYTRTHTLLTIFASQVHYYNCSRGDTQWAPVSIACLCGTSKNRHLCVTGQGFPNSVLGLPNSFLGHPNYLFSLYTADSNNQSSMMSLNQLCSVGEKN